MHEEIFRALESGATVLTAGRHLARVLAREYHSMQMDRGRTVWNRPDVLPLAAYLDRTWSEWLARYADESSPILLNPVQEHMLWEWIIRESPAGASLLQVPETAAKVLDTWGLVIAYRLPVDGSYEACEDWAAFAAWSREFRRQCRANRWLEHGRVADFLRDRIQAGEVSAPSAVFLAGFDEITPQQKDFFEALGNCRALPTKGFSSVPALRKSCDLSEEIRGAAEWARSSLEADPEAQIGIIVAPDLTGSRSKVERIFGEVLEPGVHEAEGERAFHLSVGPKLAEYPIVRAALLMLEFAAGKLPLPRAGLIVRSPFLGGADKEFGKRAQLDARLRRKGVWDVSLDQLRDEAGSCGELQRVLRRVEKYLRSVPAEQTPGDWSRSIEDLLDAFGWPGDRPPSSREFQTVAAWRGLLSALATLDLTTQAMNLAQVIEWLHQQAATTRFQVEDEGAPVQIMGMLEAAGLRFDHLWIMGLHDEAIPAPANPNPFLPTSLQLRYRVPHSSADRELEFATALMDRLCTSAPDVVVSYPAAEGDRVLSPSPLIAEGIWSGGEEHHRAEWITRIREAAVFEELADDTAPALLQTGSPGGASLFKDMAACPFRSFAKHRLGARPLEETDQGLSYRDRGSTVHKALEIIWRELGSHARLVEMASGELDALIERGASEAVATVGPGIGRDLEKRRLQKLLLEWLNLEKARSDFSVKANEEDRVVAIGGLEVRVRADRVDVLPDGREIILDYKTGLVKAGGWEGERPNEPQLPLYCATSSDPVAGAAFAIIRTGELRFRGLTAPDTDLPSMAKMSAPAIPFPDLMVEWRGVLEHLAEDYRTGRADVDPKETSTCENCGLWALCRIREAQNDR